jgi:hypothetical protein
MHLCLYIVYMFVGGDVYCAICCLLYDVCCAVLCCAVLCCAMLCYAMLCCAVCCMCIGEQLYLCGNLIACCTVIDVIDVM